MRVGRAFETGSTLPGRDVIESVGWMESVSDPAGAALSDGPGSRTVKLPNMPGAQQRSPPEIGRAGDSESGLRVGGYVSKGP